MEYKYDLSIYVATYNHEKYIKRALDSIFNQKQTILTKLLSAKIIRLI